jgi:hypothetical protein
VFAGILKKRTTAATNPALAKKYKSPSFFRAMFARQPNRSIMTFHPRTVFVTLCLIFTAALHAQSNGPYKLAIDSVQGFFFGGVSGTLSSNVLEDSIGHFNIIIDNDPVEQMMIQVKVKYVDGDDKATTWVQLVVKEAGKTIVSRKIRVPGTIRDSGTWSAAFMVYDIGCANLDISAQLLGEAPSPVVKKQVKLYCGE